MAVSELLLQQVPFYAGMSAACRTVCAQRVNLRNVAKGEVIARYGEVADDLLVLFNGRAYVYWVDEDGREVIFDTLSKGSLIGEISLLDREQRSANVVMVEDGTLLALNGAMFYELMERFNDFSANLLREMAGRLRRANAMIGNLALLDVYGRVARWLLDNSEPMGSHRVIERQPTRQDLAKMVGATREMVTKVMRDLERCGTLRREEGGRLIIDERGLGGA
ncbi:MAG: hypothetical protein RIR00_1156 [Pseudomonadota bacterium]